MTRFFTRERFGRPQFLAGALLVAFLAQATWLVYCDLHSAQPRAYDVAGGDEQVRVAAGWRQLHQGAIAGAPFPDPPGALDADSVETDAGFDAEHSPLLPLVTAAPLLALPQRMLQSDSSSWHWFSRIPFLACGVLLGASLWYVARRLCGNTGGFVALSLYCFSPSIIQASAVWRTDPEILAAWGAFGAIFTAIAVAHTLYAPREVILWNWRRIILLGISLAIAVGSQFSMVVVVPLALVFLFYLAPIRRTAAFIIWTAACLVGLMLLFAAYFFHPHAFLEGMRHASFWGATWRGFTVPGVYRQVGLQILRACPALAVLLPVAIATFLVWPRSRYFGNSAPGAVALLFIGLGMAHPHVAGAGFLLASVPFLLIFVSGVLADLMETPARLLVTACVWGLVGAYILWSVLALSQIPRA
jgi:hypothetical protein